MRHAGEGAIPMFEAMEREISHLSVSVRKLSVIAAALKLRHDSAVDPRIRDLFIGGANSTLGADVGSLEDRDASMLIGMIDMTFAEASELLHNPARPAEWQVVDPVLLQTQGRASSVAFQRILKLAATRPLLRRTLAGRFLDVGTGVAGIAIAAAGSCPSLLVEGIDVWEPALALASQNVEESPYADRITIRNLDVTRLAGDPAYDLVWLPTMFMKRSVLEAALDRIAATSMKGAYLVAARYTPPADPAAATFVTLRTLRSGGDLISQSEMEQMIRERGFIDIESDVAPFATFTLGRYP
jgi:SAM-dependent methyltransferase